MPYVAKQECLVVPFTSLPAMYVVAKVEAFAAGKISRAVLNELLAKILPPRQWVDCGAFEVQVEFTSDADILPFTVFLARQQSADGRCPVCHMDDAYYMHGEGDRVVLWCRKCQTAYSASEGVLCGALR